MASAGDDWTYKHGLLVRQHAPRAMIPRRNTAMTAHALHAPSHGIPLGFMRDRGMERWIYYNHRWQKSLITIAPNRSGKTLMQLAQELGVYGGRINGVAPSVAVNDKKGELIQICGRARYELGDTVYKVDPMGIVPSSPYWTDAKLNILDGLTPDDTTEILTISGGLIVAQGNDPHWFERPRQLIACLLAHMLDDNTEPAELPYLMKILQLPDEKFQDYMAELAEYSPVPFVRGNAAAFAAEDDKQKNRDPRENRAIVSSALGQLGFLSDRKIAALLSGRSSFRWEDLKRGGISVFFCLPEKVALMASRFVRTFWTSAVSAMYQSPKHPVLFVIDEASSSLGTTSELFETAFALGGGFGLRLHLLFQNLPQLYGLFREQSESVMSSAGVRQFFRPNDRTTAQYLAERAGNVTYPVMQENQTFNSGSTYTQTGESFSTGDSTSYSTQYFSRPKYTEQQLYEMSARKQILLFEGIGAPVIADRMAYYETQWASRFDDNPYA